VWAVTHVCRRGLGEGGPKANRTYLAVAISEEKATAKVHLITGLPYEELHTKLVRRDPAPVPSEEWRASLECCLGCIDDFWPRTCPSCKGRGTVRDQVSDDDRNRVRCSLCKGTGTKPRRSRTPEDVES